MSRVAIFRSRKDDRKSAILRALSAIEGEIKLGSRILVKPNLVSTTKQLAATHVDALRGVLQFLRDRTDAEIMIGEGASMRDTFDGYRNFGYFSLVDEYGVKLIDFNRDRWIPARIFDTDLKDLEVRIARTVVESDFRISVCPPKTHDVVIVTLSLKNMIVGSLIRDELGTLRTFGGLAWQLFSTRMLKQTASQRSVDGLADRDSSLIARSDKMAIHCGHPAINMTLARLTPLTYPHLSVIDGTIGMEGNGPTNGTPVDLGLIITGTDFLSVDTVTARIMGFDPKEIGYLEYLRRLGMGVVDLDQIEIVGEKLESCIMPFRPHSNRISQSGWKLDEGKAGGVERAVDILRKNMPKDQPPPPPK